MSIIILQVLTYSWTHFRVLCSDIAIIIVWLKICRDLYHLFKINVLDYKQYQNHPGQLFFFLQSCWAAAIAIAFLEKEMLSFSNIKSAFRSIFKYPEMQPNSHELGVNFSDDFI